MADHIMTAEPIPGALGTNDGYQLCKISQVTNAAVANNDTLTWNNTKDVIPVSITSEKGSIIDFDASAVNSTTNWRLTVNATVLTTGTAATWIKGLALVQS
jgi:hypothetical protein